MKQENLMPSLRDLQGSEHPETARLRLGKEMIDMLSAIKREGADNTYAYINELLGKAREELQHARSASNDHRKVLLSQHVDEIVAYLRGIKLDVKTPRLQDEGGKGASRSFVLDDVPNFFGEVRCAIDQWHADHLSAVHKEIAIMHNLQARGASRSSE